MKTAVKYGLIITLGVAIWVIADHFLLHISASGKAAFLTPIFFNLLQLVVLFLGIRAHRQENRDRLTLGQGIRCGLAISLVYAITASVFFLAFYLIVGSKALQNEPGALGSDRPERYVIMQAFAGLFLGALIAGLIYSTVISFGLRPLPQAGSDRQSQSRQSRRRG